MSREKLALLVLSALLGACSEPTRSEFAADVIYENGLVYTVDRDQPWASGFAVRDGRFVGVGSSESLAGLRGESTRMEDLQGRLVLPGLVDDHIHPDLAAESYYNVNIDAEADSYDDFAAAVRAYLQANPDAPWVYGGSIDYMWDDGSSIRMFDKPSHKSIIDELVDDRPAYFWEVSGHAALVNTKALELLGVTKDTPDPPGGYFVRDENGELTGLVRETAAHVVWEEYLKDQPPATEIAYKRIVPIFQYLNSLGITSITDVWSREWYMESYVLLDKNGDLTLRVSSFVTDPSDWVNEWMKEKSRQVIANPDEYTSENVRLLGVKFVLDGGAAGRTAVLTEPYEGTEDDFGPWRIDPDLFTERLIAYDEMGLTVRAHAAGDGAARHVLDGVEELRKRGSTLRHAVAHTAILNPADIPRFAELDVIAEFSPVFWYYTPAVDVITPDIGEERIGWLYPMRELLDSGAPLSVGSDWTVTQANPWTALETMVTRRAPGVTTGPALHAEHAITLEEAVYLYTAGGAYSQQQEHEIGSIEKGKAADFIVVDRNIFDIPIHEVHETEVVRTFVGGREVYNQSQKHEVIDFYGERAAE
ncbi:MAG: amidohydrolase [Woeseiaceae bacterium]|nr:amidohydrolase [Woeseiaceae bacterium]